jgi:hypothetical protein
LMNFLSLFDTVQWCSKYLVELIVYYWWFLWTLPFLMRYNDFWNTFLVVLSITDGFCWSLLPFVTRCNGIRNTLLYRLLLMFFYELFIPFNTVQRNRKQLVGLIVYYWWFLMNSSSLCDTAQWCLKYLVSCIVYYWWFLMNSSSLCNTVQ